MKNSSSINAFKMKPKPGFKIACMKRHDAAIMETNPDNSTTANPLIEIFHAD